MRESATEFPRTGVARCFGFYFSPNSFLAFSVTVQRYTTRQSTSIFLSGCHSPMSNWWETIAGTHFQVLEKLGAQLEVDVRQEVERHDGGIVEVGIEKVLLDEPHAVDRIKEAQENARQAGVTGDRKSTRLNSSHANISYAVFCL